jgi:hypothetical protein
MSGEHCGAGVRGELRSRHITLFRTAVTAVRLTGARRAHSARAVCDDCYADLNPAITVTVTFFSARSAGSSQPFAVIRQRTRSDHDYPGLGHVPDRGQKMTWQLC